MAKATKSITVRNTETGETHTMPVLKNKWEDAIWRGQYIEWLAKNGMELVE